MDNNQVYDEESQIYEESNIKDLNVDADRVIAMNPSGVIENFESNGKRIQCDGNQCVILEDDNNLENNCKNGVCTKNGSSYMNYIIYFIIFVILCGLAYFGYKKYTGCSS